MTLTPPQQQTLMAIARVSIRAGLGGINLAVGGFDDPVLRMPAGCFVSLHERHTHRLRGCIGRLDAQDALVVAVQTAATGVLRDPRFTQNPLAAADLPNLDMDISVLSPLRPVAHPLAFDLLNDGIYLTLGDRSGCFLPQVARETGWTNQQLLDRLCLEKLGLPANTWQNPQARLLVFSSLILGPEPFDTPV